MRPAMASVAGASRGLSPVKTGGATADDEIVTSVAFTAPGDDEPVSPELALVDPVLAERLRSRAADPAPTVDESPRVPRAPSPVIVAPEPAPAPEPVVAAAPAPQPPPEPELIADPEQSALEARAVKSADIPVTPQATVHVLRPLDDESETAGLRGAVDSPMPQPGSIAPWAAATASATRPSRASTLRRTVMAFAAGAVVAALVVVGVIAKLGESESTGTGVAAVDGDPPPSLVSPPASQSGAPSPTAGAGAPTKADGEGSAGATSNAEATSAGATKETSPTTRQARPAPARRFAWVPVEGAVSYRLELFRGDEQVLRTTTKRPVFDLASSWRFRGRTERLTPGSYRWYVWPVLPTGPVAKAVVQASLVVP